MTNNSDAKVLRSKDGSDTVHSKQFNASYHSEHGAITESKHVFIEAGLIHFIEKFGRKNSIRILELGFGTGLNALLCLLKSKELDICIDYHTLEAFPLSTDIAATLNYHSILNIDQSDFICLHTLSWNYRHKLNGQFSFTKYDTRIQEFSNIGSSYDIIFYDAFGPGTQPELWELPVLEKIATLNAIPGTLVTYCAQGAFKRNLKQLGYSIEGLPGPPGKREMTRASK